MHCQFATELQLEIELFNSKGKVRFFSAIGPVVLVLIVDHQNGSHDRGQVRNNETCRVRATKQCLTTPPSSHPRSSVALPRPFRVTMVQQRALIVDRGPVGSRPGPGLAVRPGAAETGPRHLVLHRPVTALHRAAAWSVTARGSDFSTDK